MIITIANTEPEADPPLIDINFGGLVRLRLTHQEADKLERCLGEFRLKLRDPDPYYTPITKEPSP